MIRFNRFNILKIFFLVFVSLFCFNLIKKSNKSKERTRETRSAPSSDDINALETLDVSMHKDKYLLEISSSRINKLFDILHEKENKYRRVIEHLGLISFSDYLKNRDESVLLNTYEFESNNFLKTSRNRVHVNERFVKYLYNKSQTYSFDHPRNHVVKSKITDKNPVIVTAANSAYYGALQSTIFHIHKFLPDYPLIVYDLGLDEDAYKATVKYCKCRVIKFDQEKLYSKTSPHISDLKTYAWKPLLIQETLKEFESVIYIDSSIRFKSDQIKPIIDSLADVGMLTQFIELKLNCYTNPKMYDWFHETASSYDEFFTIEANILFFHRSFLTSLIMKAWVTCALEEQCIAPVGSSIGGCCGCHRFDQDAITIVNSYFYGHPKDAKLYLPPYSFTREESYFFDIRRYEGMEYFKKL